VHTIYSLSLGNQPCAPPPLWLQLEHSASLGLVKTLSLSSVLYATRARSTADDTPRSPDPSRTRKKVVFICHQGARKSGLHTNNDMAPVQPLVQPTWASSSSFKQRTMHCTAYPHGSLESAPPVITLVFDIDCCPSMQRGHTLLDNCSPPALCSTTGKNSLLAPRLLLSA